MGYGNNSTRVMVVVRVASCKARLARYYGIEGFILIELPVSGIMG